MINIAKSNFPGTTAELAARIRSFRDAVAAHALTEGVPAPREDDLIERLARTDEAFEVVEPQPPPPPEELRALEIEAKRAAALKALDAARLAEAAAAHKAAQDALRAEDDARLAEAAEDPDAPQAVKEYASVLAK
ncbi:MAG: hypothetical protein AABM33_05890 [Pseudomonadota bacterium]